MQHLCVELDFFLQRNSMTYANHETILLIITVIVIYI